VLTVNVQNDEGDPRRMRVLKRGLRELAPDLVAFQEVVRSPERDQLAELLEGSELRGTHQAEVLSYAPPFADRYGGSAVASHWPHRIAEALDLRGADAPDVPWCSLAAIIELPDESELLFIAATTAWRPAGEAARERQVVALTDLDARHRRDLPTIIAGDFNAAPESASIRYLTGLQSLQGRSVHYHDAWAVAGQGPGHTWTSDNPTARADIQQLVGQPTYHRRLDYVFVGSWDAHPQAHAEIRSASLAFDQPVDGVWASDHFGVLAELEIGMNR
jgi:endonuclease/exonuclease/phosphatase family metal-dependent hydrolase